MGIRGACSVTLVDFTHNDKGIDPYQSDRTYDTSQGTFFGKLRARNLYYPGSPVRIYTGFYTDPFVFPGNFICREYILEDMSYPDSKGQVKIKGVDPLKMLNEETSAAPVASEVELNASITNVATSMTVKTGQGSYLDFRKNTQFAYYRIDTEIILVTAVTTDTATISRAQLGSEADDHNANAVVQRLYVRTLATNVVRILWDLLVFYSDVPTRFIDFAGFDEQKTGYLAANDIFAGISEPTPVGALMNELVSQNLFNLWFDDRASLIKIRSFIPQNVNEPASAINDNINLIFQKSSIRDFHDKRATQVWVFYSPKDYTEASDDKDFQRIHIAADTELEGDNAFGSPRIIKIHSRWFKDANAAQAISLASRLLERYSDVPVRVKFEMDLKDDALYMLDNFSIESAVLQNIDGTNLHKKMQVISAQENPQFGTITYEAEAVGLIGPYAFVAPNSTPNYTSASAAEKAAYGFIAQNDGTMTNGDDGYLIQ